MPGVAPENVGGAQYEWTAEQLPKVCARLSHSVIERRSQCCGYAPCMYARRHSEDDDRHPRGLAVGSGARENNTRRCVCVQRDATRLDLPTLWTLPRFIRARIEVRVNVTWVRIVRRLLGRVPTYLLGTLSSGRGNVNPWSGSWRVVTRFVCVSRPTRCGNSGFRRIAVATRGRRAAGSARAPRARAWTAAQ